MPDADSGRRAPFRIPHSEFPIGHQAECWRPSGRPVIIGAVGFVGLSKRIGLWEKFVAREKVILAYSGGLDTSVAVKWISEKYDMDVITYTCDLGQGRDMQAIKAKALETGAIEAVVEDTKNMFVDYFVWPSLMTGTMYEGKYPLATALGRPLIAHQMVRTAKEHGATAVAHGCTGKGNDQVRFDVSFQTLAPELKIIAPVREWKWTRTEELQYAKDHGIQVDATKQSIYSVD